MTMNSVSPFVEFLKKLAAPIGALVYLLAFAAQIHDYADRLGWRVLFLVVLCLSIAWCVYVWTARELTIIEPRRLRRSYGRWVRFGAIATIGLSVLPLGYSLRPAPIFPLMPIHLVNATDSTVSVSRHGEFFISVPATPMTNMQVASGRITILDSDSADQRYVSVLAGETRQVFAEFVNSNRLLPMLEAGDHSVRFVFYQEDGQLLTQGGVWLTHDNIADRYLLLELRPSRIERTETNGT